MAYINFDSNKEPSWANAASEMAGELGLSPVSASSAAFWGGKPALDEMVRAAYQKRDLAARENMNARTADTAANSANQAQLVQLMKALYGDFPLARATLDNKRSNEDMQRQIELMKMMSGNQLGLQKAKMQHDATLGAAEINKQGRIEASSGKIPPTGKPSEQWMMAKKQEIIKQGGINPDTKQPIISETDAEVAAAQEWITKNANFKKNILPAQLRQQAAPTPQKTSMSVDDSMGKVAMGDFVPTSNVSSLEMVPGSETTDPQQAQKELLGLYGLPDYSVTDKDRKASRDYYSDPTQYDPKKPRTEGANPMSKFSTQRVNRIPDAYYTAASQYTRNKILDQAMKEMYPEIYYDEQKDDYTGIPSPVAPEPEKGPVLRAPKNSERFSGDILRSPSFSESYLPQPKAAGLTIDQNGPLANMPKEWMLDTETAMGLAGASSPLANLASRAPGLFSKLSQLMKKKPPSMPPGIGSIEGPGWGDSIKGSLSKKNDEAINAAIGRGGGRPGPGSVEGSTFDQLPIPKRPDNWFREGGKVKYNKASWSDDPGWADNFFNQVNQNIPKARDNAADLITNTGPYTPRPKVLDEAMVRFFNAPLGGSEAATAGNPNFLNSFSRFMDRFKPNSGYNKPGMPIQQPPTQMPGGSPIGQPPLISQKATGQQWPMGPQSPAQGMQLGSGGFAKPTTMEEAYQALMRSLYGM